MESISCYGHYGGSDEEQENSNNSKPRDNPSSTKNHSHGSSASASSVTTTNNLRRRKVTDDTNYEEIQMDLSEDSNDSSESHSSPAKISDVKPKKRETDFMSQPSSHRSSDKHNRYDEKSTGLSKELDRYRGDKSKESSSSRDRATDKPRDKVEKYRNRDKDRERERDRDRDRYSRDKGRSRSEKDDKYSRHRDNRSDNRRDRSDKNDHRRSDKDRHDRGRDRHTNSNTSKSRSRSREATTRPYQHDRSAIKEPPKSLMSLQLPQMPLLAATSTTKQIEPVTITTNNIITTTSTITTTPAVALPNLISPLLASARYTEQMQKRKLLWGNKKVEGEQQQTTNNRWEQTKFSQDSDGKMASKFLRLMGMKDAPKVDEEETQKSTAPDSIKKQNEMLTTMEHQYEVARQMTHTMRGMGLGFGTQPRNY